MPDPMTPTGWICPRCNRVNSPAVRYCKCPAIRLPLITEPEPQQPAIAPSRPSRTCDPIPEPPRVYCGGQDVERYNTRPPAA